jgi:hypothetical protein
MFCTLLVLSYCNSDSLFQRSPTCHEIVSSWLGSVVIANNAYSKPRGCLSRIRSILKQITFLFAECCMSHLFTLHFSTLNIILFRLLYASTTKHGTIIFFHCKHYINDCLILLGMWKYHTHSENVYINCLKYREFYNLNIKGMWVIIHTLTEVFLNLTKVFPP